MKKSILVITDFSESSKCVFGWTVKLCLQMQCDLLILHTYRLTNKNIHEDIIDWKRKTEAAARDEFSRIEEEVLRNCGVKYNLKVEVGFIADRVNEIISKNDDISFLVIDKLMHDRNKESFDELMETVTVPIIVTPVFKQIKALAEP